MFERFTDRARRVYVLAHEEAKQLNHSYIGTEHVLLGLIHEGEGVAVRALENLGVSLDVVREQVEDIIGRGLGPVPKHIPFTPRAKKVMELSLRVALELGHNYIGTEHILLALVREGEGVAAQVLARTGVELGVVRQEVLRLLGGYAARVPVSDWKHVDLMTPRSDEVRLRAKARLTPDSLITSLVIDTDDVYPIICATVTYRLSDGSLATERIRGGLSLSQRQAVLVSELTERRKAQLRLRRDEAAAG